MFLNELNCWVPAISGRSTGWERESCLMSSLSQFGSSPNSWRRREEIINIHCRVFKCQTCFPAVLLSLITTLVRVLGKNKWVQTWCKPHYGCIDRRTCQTGLGIPGVNGTSPNLLVREVILQLERHRALHCRKCQRKTFMYALFW